MRRWRWLWWPLFLAVWWVGCAPVAVGGSVSYSVVQGRSMVPTFHSGDLVLTRSEGGHQAGDVVLARHGHGAVLHRLVSRERTGVWRTRGDANHFLDGWRICDGDIVGRMWVVVPGGGTALRWVAAHPFFTGWCAAMLGLVVGWPWRATWRAFGRWPTRP